MLRKSISFSLILLLLYLIYQFLINSVKYTHFITYTISNDESFNIEESYSKDNGDYYLLKISNDDKSFVFEVDNYFNKQKNIVSDIKTFEDNGYYCIGVVYLNNKYYSYPMCTKNNVLYSYNSIKDEVDFGDYLKNIKNEESEKYSKESIRVEEADIILNKDFFDEKEVLTIYGYKQVSVHYKNFNRMLSFSTVDNYKNDYGVLADEYYVIPKLTLLASYKSLYIYDLNSGEKEEALFPREVSKNSYVNGSHNGKLYIFDRSELRQYEVDLDNHSIVEIGNTDKDGFAYINGEEKTISVYELNANTILFSENADDYNSIDYDDIYIDDNYIIYRIDNSFYKAYKKYLDNPIFLFEEEDMKNIIVKYGNIYYIKDDSIYKYNEYGSHVMATREEFKYNYDNIFDVFYKTTDY